MGFELINRITIKKDGVYFSTKSSNDDCNYHSTKINTLSEVYNKEGQKGLDREIMRLLYSCAELKGHHPSLDKYYYAMSKARENDIYNYYLDKVNDKYYELSDEDKQSLHKNPTEKAKEYSSYCKNIKDEMYGCIGAYCSEYENIKNNEIENDEPDITDEY